MNDKLYRQKYLLTLALVTLLPLTGHTSGRQIAAPLPPSPMPQINAMLNIRSAAIEQIKVIQLKARTLISRAEVKLERARIQSKTSSDSLENSWNSRSGSLSDLDQAAQQYKDTQESSKLARQTMQEVFLFSESKIGEIKQQIKQVEHEIEQIRVTWVQRHGAKILDVARELKKRTLEAQIKGGREVSSAQSLVTQTNREIATAKNHLKAIQHKALQESHKMRLWVKEQEKSAKQAQSKTGQAWGRNSGSYGEMRQELEGVRTAENQLKLANSQAQVVQGLVEAEIAVSQARIESLQARLRSERGTLGMAKIKSNKELGIQSQREEIIRTLSSLVRGPLQYKN
jgi:hypothetical protein